MPKLPQIKPRDLEKLLVAYGFTPHPTKSSHVVFKHHDGRRTVIPGHNEPVRKGTLSAILRQCKLTVDDLLDFLKKKKSVKK